MNISSVSVRLVVGVLLFSLSLPVVAAKVDYMVSAGFLYDSNFGQNIQEQGKGYFIPEGYLKLRGDSVPLFLKVAIDYENYISERLPTLNSPFFSVSGGVNSHKDILNYKLELKAALYFDIGDSIGDPIGWASAKNSYRMYNNFHLKVQKYHRIILNTQVQYNDYATDTHDAVRVSVDPQYQYRFRMLKKDKVKLARLYALTEYEGNFANSDSYSYTYWGVGGGAQMKFWAAKWDFAGSYAGKSYWGTITDQTTGNQIKVENTYWYLTSKLVIPIVADLDFQLRGKLRFKGSNYTNYDWNRHTIEAKIIWRSTMGKYRS